MPGFITQLLIEAAFSPRMAGYTADLFYPVADRVIVAIEQNFYKFLHVSRLLALAPELAPGAGPINGPIFTNRCLQGLSIEPGLGQNPSGMRLLGDYRHQTIFIPFDLIEIGGHRLSMQLHRLKHKR